MKTVAFSELQGLALQDFVVSEGGDQIEISAGGRRFVLEHDQGCCESVVVESISGDWKRAIGEVVTEAVENHNQELPKKDQYDESWTWTFYTIRTHSATIVIRWYGTSNGYYSEGVDFKEI